MTIYRMIVQDPQTHEDGITLYYEDYSSVEHMIKEFLNQELRVHIECKLEEE